MSVNHKILSRGLLRLISSAVLLVPCFIQGLFFFFTQMCLCLCVPVNAAWQISSPIKLFNYRIRNLRNFCDSVVVFFIFTHGLLTLSSIVTCKQPKTICLTVMIVFTGKNWWITFSPFLKWSSIFLYFFLFGQQNQEKILLLLLISVFQTCVDMGRVIFMKLVQSTWSPLFVSA